MNSFQHNSLAVDKLSLSTSDIIQSNLIGFFMLWLTIITSFCLKFINRVKRDVGISKALAFLFQTSSNKEQLPNAGIETQSKLGAQVYKLAAKYLKNFPTLVASMGELCTIGGFILIQAFFTKCRNLLGLTFLVVLFLFNPSESMQSHAADPRVTLVGAGPNDSLNMMSENSTAFERNAVFYYALSVPYGTTLDFTINFSVTERQHDDFLADKNENRSLNLAAILPWQKASTDNRNPPTIQYIQGFVRFNDDNVDEIDGVITFTLKSGTGYTISETASDNIATINVTDDDGSDKKPKISLLGVGVTADTMESSYMRTLPINENATPNQNTTVYFLLNTPATANTNFTINYELTERSNDNFIVGDETERTLDLTNLSSPDVVETSGSIKYIRGSFSIANDDMDEANGEITLTLQGGSAYVNAGAAVTVNVTDDDVPLVSISENNGMVSESTPSITYTLSATPTPHQDITINLMIMDPGDFIAGDPDPDIVMTTADNGTKPVTVILQDDRDDEADNSIIIQVIAGDGSDPGYEPVAEPTQPTDPLKSITINVSDDDVPSISIIGDASVNEDDNAIFRVTADINPRVDLTINVNVTQNPNEDDQLLYSDADQMGNHSTTVSMATTDNQETQLSLPLNDMSGGFITVTIVTHSDGNYELNTTNDAHIHTIQVIDPDTAPTGPVIELVPTTATITEGTDAVFNFQVATGGTVTTALELDLSITQTGSFFDESLIVKTVTIATSGMGEKTIPTLDDDTDEANGSIIVSILQGRLTPAEKNYQISEDTAKFTQSITVQDNDIPQVSITGPSGSISESDDSFNYILTAIPKPYQPITIILDISQTGDVFATTPSASIELSEIGTKTETITFDDDTNLELDSKITIRVASGTGYDPVLTSIPNADPSNTISFIVTDDDFPQVSISESNGTVNESGGIISYTLSATPTPLQDISIELSIVETGDVIAGIPVTTVEMKSSDVGSKTGIIVLVDDTIDEVDSTITIQVLNGTGYVTVSNPSETTDPQHTITILVADDDIPQISITGGTSVSEEDDFVFTLQADIAPRKEITISIGLSDEPFNVGDQLYDANTARTVNMNPSHYRMTTYIVKPNKKRPGFNLEKDRRGGFVTVTVNPSSDNEYAPADFGNSHTIRIIDQNPDSIPDGPIVELAPNSEMIMSDTTITEGDNALINFQVASDTRLSSIVSGLTVDLRITQTGNFFDESQITKTVGIATDGRGEKTISTVDDDIDEADGSITVEIIPGHGDIATKNYRISNDPAKVSHTIMVADNDTPQVSISENNGTVSEGDGFITFMLTATPRPYQEIFITVDIMDRSGNGIFGSPLKTIPMTVSGTAIGLINLNDNNIDEMDNTITIQVKSGAGDNPRYEPVGDSVEDSGPEHTIEITVADNDVPQISITGSRAVSDNAVATFTLSADILPRENISIIIGISQSPYTDNQLLYDGADPMGNQPRTIEMMTTDTGSKEFTIVLFNMGSGGTITVTVDTSTDGKYTPAPVNSGGSFTTLIIDEDSPPDGPFVELLPVTSTTITEGTQLEFTIQAIIPAGGTVLTNRLEVNLGISQIGNYLDGVQPNTVTISTRGTASISILTDDDDINEPNGSYTVEILRGSKNPSNKNYKLSGEPAKVSQTIMVQDNDIPQVSISRIAEVVSERDQTISYIITATPAPNQDITIEVNITETGAVISGIPNTMITMSTTGIASGEIMLNDDEEDEYDSRITIQVLSGTGYQPVSESTPNAEPSNTITILVKDDEELDLKIAIHEGVTGPIEAGRPVEFVLTSTEDLPAGGLNIDIQVSQKGSFIPWRLPRSVHMVSSPQTLTIETVKRAGQDEEGAISVVVLPGLNSYGVDEGNQSAGFRITNANPITTPDDEARISVASLVVDQLIDLINPPTESASPAQTDPSLISSRPTVSISSPRKIIDEGIPIELNFAIVNGENTSNLNIAFQISQGTHLIVGSANQNVAMRGHDTVSISIPTVDDDRANDDGIVSIGILEHESYLISADQNMVEVIVSDAVDRHRRLTEITAHAQAFLPDLTGRMGANNLGIVSNRITQGFSADSNLKLELGGQNSIAGMLTTGGERLNESVTTMKSFLSDSSFAVSLISGDEFAIPTTLWGLGDYQDFSSPTSNQTFDWSGDLFTGHIGIDALFGEGLLTGISASVSESEVEFDNFATNEILFNVRTTSLNPYFGWTSPNRNSELHATIGLGQGEIGIKQESYTNAILDSESFSFGLTGNQVLFTSNSTVNGTTRLSIKGDSWFAHQSIAGSDGILADIHTNAHHLRIRSEGTHQFDFSTGSTLRPLVSIGIRNDVKDHQSVLGIELSSGADYHNPIGLTVTGTGSMLVGQANQAQKVTISSSLNYDYSGNERGIIVEVTPSWGNVGANIQNTFWSNRNLDANFESSQYTNGTSLSGELGYGLDILDSDSVLTPFSGIEISDDNANQYLIGTRLGLGSNANFELSGIQEQSITGSNTTKVRLEGRMNW